MPGPLAHLKVLDLSRILAGPWATQILADLGADIVKVERPGAGDDTRGWGPPYLRDASGRDTSESTYFACANRNKRSLTLDLASHRGQALTRELAAEADILVENFKTGSLAKYGLDYPSLRAINPGLIYCSITGFGQTGPYAPRAGYDFVIQGMGGVMSVTGPEEGAPMKAGIPVSDVMTGLYATIGILAALAHRDRTGEGQHVDTALMDVTVAMMVNHATGFLATGRNPARWANAHPSIVPYQAFETADGFITVAVGNDEQFQRFAQAIGRPDLAEDDRFLRNADRVRNRAALVPALEDAVRGYGSGAILAALDAVGVPCGPINDLSAVFADPHVQARSLRVDLPHPLAGTMATVASPVRLSSTPVEYRRAPPLLGADSEAVLRDWLDMPLEEIADLRASGIL